MPPLSIDDAAHLHDAVLRFLILAAQGPSQKAQLTALQGIISTCWWRRLPLNGGDIWPMLIAHGVSEKYRSVLGRHFDFGIDLLRSVNGRRAIKGKRMPSFSQNRYLSKAQRELWTRIFGHG